MTRDYYPARPFEWLRLLAEGWRFDDEFAPDWIEWNNGWPVVLMVREVAT